MKKIRGGFTAAGDFLAAGLHCGIKPKKEFDLALLYSARPAVAAGVMTANAFRAAPLRITEKHLKRGSLRAVIVNSGNANALTGRQGYRDAEKMARAVSASLNLRKEQVAVASTGVIGQPLPLDKILQKIPMTATRLSHRGSRDAARAIRTTDTVDKETAFRARVGGRMITVGGIAKGSGMVHPRMATMLGFLSTDAHVTPSALKRALSHAVDHSFNAITVDGSTSTNDMVLCMANGTAENPCITVNSPWYSRFQDLMETACAELSKKIVRDGEGATKVIEIRVLGARTERAAKTVASAVANSPLVKTAFFGEDANWGRIMAAVGQAGLKIREGQVDISFGDFPLVKGGRRNPKVSEQSVNRYLKRKEVSLTIHLHNGSRHTVMWTCDLSYGYIKINASYRS